MLPLVIGVLAAWFSILLANKPCEATPPAYQRENQANMSHCIREEKWVAANVATGTSVQSAKVALQSAGYVTKVNDSPGRLSASKRFPLDRPWHHVIVTVALQHREGTITAAQVDSTLVLGRRWLPWQWFPIHELLFER